MFENLFTKIEEAIDNHADLERVRVCDKDGKLVFVHQPVMEVERSGFRLHILVKLKGSRKKPSEIWADGGSAEETADKFVEHLNYWAEALK